MFSEFFLRSGLRVGAVAWCGLLTVVGYALFMALIRKQLNEFYSKFYDLMQNSGQYVDAGSGDAEALALDRARVWEQLASFGRIVLPLVLASPTAKWIRSAWAFEWRAVLMRSYLKAWDTNKEPIEGASQRLHEDTQRFCNALQGCLVTLLDAIFTLIIFTPILLELSHEVTPPIEVGELRGVWLWALAFGAALFGLGGAMVCGSYLVQLEVNNQKVEAALRKDLVLLETTPATVLVGSSSTREVHIYNPWSYFKSVLFSLRRNYHALFRHFSILNLFLSAHDQAMVLCPYLIAAPMLFAEDPARRITLGTLVKLSNSFEKVFSSLSILAENWGAVNEFRSVLRRLSEFEGQLYSSRPSRRGNCLLPAQDSSSSSTTTQPPERQTELVVVDGGPIVEGSQISIRTSYGGGDEPDMRI
jgi:peptide/bleomycin uptake transporter